MGRPVRTNQMKDGLAELIDHMKEQRLCIMAGLFLNPNSSVMDELKRTLEKLKAGKSQGFLVAAYLHSSYLTGSHELFLAHYMGDFFVEEEPDCQFLSIKPLFQGIEDDYLELNKALEGNYIRIFSGEKEEIRRWYMRQLYKDMGILLKPAFRQDTQGAGMEIYFGGYMDCLELLGRI